MHFGIDFGSKRAGTTVICYNDNKSLNLLQSEKGKDSDAFILNYIDELKPQFVFLDAPLTLPMAYYSEKHSNFHFRECDVECKAMSPLFLGGLTARAMDLKRRAKVPFHETYPGYFARNILDIPSKMKKVEPKNIQKIMEKSPWLVNQEINNVHQLDAIIAWISGHRWKNNKAIGLGNKKEGLIIV